MFPSVDFDFSSHPYMKSKLLVCSDGLYNNASDREIASVLKGKDETSLKANELIAIANANGGSDNIAISLWEADE